MRSKPRRRGALSGEYFGLCFLAHNVRIRTQDAATAAEVRYFGGSTSFSSFATPSLVHTFVE